MRSIALHLADLYAEWARAYRKGVVLPDMRTAEQRERASAIECKRAKARTVLRGMPITGVPSVGMVIPNVGGM